MDLTDLGDWDKILAKQLNVFVFADEPTKRSDVASKLSRSEMIFPLEAMRFLLKPENSDLLARYVVQADENGVSIPSQRYQISGNVDDIVISPLPPL